MTLGAFGTSLYEIATLRLLLRYSSMSNSLLELLTKPHF